MVYERQGAFKTTVCPTKKLMMSGIKNDETILTVQTEGLETLPTEVLEVVFSNFTLRECAQLCSVSRKIRSVALYCICTLSNETDRCKLSQVLDVYRPFLNKKRLHTLDLAFPACKPSILSEEDELTQLMALLKSWNCNMFQKANMELNLFSADIWFTDFIKVASKTLTELTISFSMPRDLTMSAITLILDGLQNLNSLQIGFYSVFLLALGFFQEEREEMEPYMPGLTQHKLTSLKIFSDIGDLGIGVSFFEKLPNIRKLRLHGNVRGVQPEVFYRRLIEYCPKIEHITYIDTGFDFLEEALNQGRQVQLYPHVNKFIQEYRSQEGNDKRRFYSVYGDARTQGTREHVKAILSLYHKTLVSVQFNALNEEQLKLVTVDLPFPKLKRFKGRPVQFTYQNRFIISPRVSYFSYLLENCQSLEVIELEDMKCTARTERAFKNLPNLKKTVLINCRHSDDYEDFFIDDTLENDETDV